MTRNTPAPEFDRASARANTLGAEYDGEGTNFALFSDHATRVELCLFADDGKTETHRLDVPEMAGGIWFVYLPRVKPGQAYGYRVHGPYEPEAGHRFNPNKLLLDPYARMTVGEIGWNKTLFGYPLGGSDLEFDEHDSAPFMPKAVVADPDFDWDADRALRHPWERSVIYEAHVKGLTKRHPEIDAPLRGTFAGLGTQPVIDHLKAIGVTAIELLPVHGFVQDWHLVDKGLSNYWGYNSLSFFAPHSGYLKSGHIREAKEAIRRFHKAGIEVILDVVYNHTAEGSEMGPTLSFRGIDNRSYYLLSPEAPRHSYDTTGTGNTLNVAHPMVLRMVLDSLRYWVEVFHVDGFRFDLASTLGREPTGFEREGGFFHAIRQDPVLRQVKLIAEPWDVGEGGYQVGGFPWPFREWNDKFRDDMRAFWRRDPVGLPAVAERLAGSPVQFDHSHRPATSSINFLAAHDGFTLADTVSYNDKHNEANGEDNNDGHSHNLSDNMGVEGETDDETVIAARLRRRKAMLASLLVSQGVPMLLAGDELGQSQGGNNNAYCQDNEITWIDWESADPALQDAVTAMTALRDELGIGSRDWMGTPGGGEICWWHPEGREMTQDDWNAGSTTLIGVELRRETRTLILVNAGDDADFVLPEGKWRHRLDTAGDDVRRDNQVNGKIALGWQSVAVLAG